MADETVEKKYLIDIETNIDEYIKEAAEAKKKLEDMKYAVDQLKEGQFKSREEVEKTNAAYRNAQKEYNEAKKMVDLSTQANTANVNSRKQLAAIVALEQQRLGKLADSYTINAQGQRVLSEEYIKAVKRLDDAKQAVIAYDKAQHDGRSSIGLYSEALEGMSSKFKDIPGPLKGATQALGGVNTSLKALLANPVILIIAAIVAVFKLLYDAFKRTQENSIVLQRAVGAVSGVFNTLMNVLRPVAEFIADKVVKVFDFLGKTAEKALGFVSKALNFLGFKKAAESVTEWTAALKEGAKAGADLAEAEVRLRNAQRDLERTDKEFLKAEEKLRQIRDDEALSIDKRIKANKELGDLLIKHANTELVVARQALQLAQDRIKLKGETEDNLDKQAEALTKIADIEERINGYKSEQLSQANALKKEAEARVKEAKAKLDEEVKAEQERLQKIREEREKAGVDEINRLREKAEAEKELELEKQQTLLEIRTLAGEDQFKIQRDRLQLEYDEEIRMATLTGQDVSLIKQKYSLAQKQIDEAEAKAKLGLYQSFAGNLATIFGKNTAIGKAAAVAQTAIATYTAAMEAYKSVVGVPVVGPGLAVVAAGAAVAAGLANIKSIIAVKSGLPGESNVSAPTSISSTIPAQRALAPSANIFTPTRVSQGELNALPNSQGGLTNDGLIEALRNMPPPVVSVEQIDNVRGEKTKVEARANI